MKVPAAPNDTQQAYAHSATTRSDAGFQQLVRQLEQTMWPGAHGGLAPSGSRVTEGSHHPSQARDNSLVHARTPFNLPDGEARAAPSELHMPFARQQTQAGAPGIVPPVVKRATVRQGSHASHASIATAFMPASSTPRHAAVSDAQADHDTTIRPARTLPRSNDVDRITVLDGHNTPGVIVRFAGPQETIAQLERAIRYELHRHGLSKAWLTINGIGSDAWKDTGGEHGD